MLKNVSCPGQGLLTMDSLVSELNVSCKAYGDSEGLCNGYFFANDKNFSAILDGLNKDGSMPQSETIRAAVLIGESHFLSMLPELSRHCNLVILNDTSSAVNKFVGFLLEIFEASDTREAFEQKFKGEANPLWKVKGNSPLRGRDFSSQMLAKDSAGNKFFLASEDRFQACKTAAKNLRFCITGIDICKPQTLLTCFQKHNAKLTVLNLTNVLDYCDNVPSLVALNGFLTSDIVSSELMIMASSKRNALNSKMVIGGNALFPRPTKKDIETLLRQIYDARKSKLPTNSGRNDYKFQIVATLLNGMSGRHLNLSFSSAISRNTAGFKLENHLSGIVDVICANDASGMIYHYLRVESLKKPERLSGN